MPNWTHDTSYEGDDTEAVLWTVLTLIIAFAFAAIALILFEGLCAPPPSTGHASPQSATTVYCSFYYRRR